MNRLPLELVDFILECLVPDTLPEPTSEERSTLCACCLVHSIWRQKLQLRLLYLIGGSRSAEQLELLLAAFELRPLLATHVHELQVGDLTHWKTEIPLDRVGLTVTSLLERCTSVADFSLHCTASIPIPLRSVFSSPS